jgi:alpha-beta hydrolase superfamily lysophospholipase/SAM-dependent methyltransferase
MTEHHFTSWDGVALFYRAWLPEKPAEKALVLFHRGHEHSGRFSDLVRRLGLFDFAVFAWDMRGHGNSPGVRGWAESFACLVRDADCFVKHVCAKHAVAIENVGIVAHSVGAVIAAAWAHDYAPPVRVMVLGSPAFRVKLYVPFALPFLRLRGKFQKKAFVKSYVRPGMLTHDPAECASYVSDALIAKAVSVNLLVGMRDTAARVVADAGAIRTPTLLLSSRRDYVVRLADQREFFRRLGSPMKEIREYPGAYHDLFHERDRAWPIAHTREFLLRAFERPVSEDITPSNQAAYMRLSQQPPAVSLSGMLWGAGRLFLKTAGKLSHGIRLGWEKGFDSGDSLDYVYRNQSGGATALGRLVDRIYLNSPGWRGIRERKTHLEALIGAAIERLRAEGRPVHILDPAAGAGRYVLDTVSRLKEKPVAVTLRDQNPSSVEAAARLARELNLTGVQAIPGDAFDRLGLASIRPRPGIAVVSGLYELFPDNDQIRESLLGLADALGEGGYLIYTNQPWHPQLEMIARVLDNREGQRWVMRPRYQAEMDALVRSAGFEKLEMLIGADGIFTVSLARLRASAETHSRRELTAC